MKESRNFELDHLQKKKRKKALATWRLSGLVLSQCLCATGHVVCHENTQRWMLHCYKGL